MFLLENWLIQTATSKSHERTHKNFWFVMFRVFSWIVGHLEPFTDD